MLCVFPPLVSAHVYQEYGAASMASKGLFRIQLRSQRSVRLAQAEMYKKMRGRTIHSNATAGPTSGA